MAATFESLDLLGTDLAHPRPRPRFAGPVAPPPRAVPKPPCEADLDAPRWPGAATEPSAPIRVEVPWIKVTPPGALERVANGPITLVPDDEADDEANDDIAAELLELETPDEDDVQAIIEAVAPPQEDVTLIVEADAPPQDDVTLIVEADAAPQDDVAAIVELEAVAQVVVEPEAVAQVVVEPEVVAQVVVEPEAVAQGDFDEFESAWFAEDVVIEEPRRVAWWEVILPVSAGLGATSLFATVIAIARAWG